MSAVALTLTILMIMIMLRATIKFKLNTHKRAKKEKNKKAIMSPVFHCRHSGGGGVGIKDKNQFGRFKGITSSGFCMKLLLSCCENTGGECRVR